MVKKKEAQADMSVEEKLKSLYQLQTMLSEIDKIKTLRGELPLEVQDLEDEIEGLKTRIENTNAEIVELRSRINEMKGKIDMANSKLESYKSQLDNVRNNREFDSLSKEIEYQKLEIELCEKRIKESTADTKVKKKMIEDAQAVVADRLVPKREDGAVFQFDGRGIADIRLRGVATKRWPPSALPGRAKRRCSGRINSSSSLPTGSDAGTGNSPSAVAATPGRITRPARKFAPPRNSAANRLRGCR